MKPKIFTLNCNSWIGQLTKNSFKVQQPVCPVCNRELQEEIKYAKMELEIDKYNDEDMIAAYGQIIVSERLYQALHEDGITGFAPLKVDKVKFEYGNTDIDSVPKLIYLAILPPAVRNIPIAHDFTVACEGCNLLLVQYNEEKFKLSRRDSTENAVHLQAYHDSYQGADIFNFTHHGETGVTQKFLDIIKDFNCPQNIIIPADWI